jgi:hypothetical protein
VPGQGLGQVPVLVPVLGLELVSEPELVLALVPGLGLGLAPG